MAATHSLSLTAASSQYATISDGASPNIDITGSQTWETWVSLAALSTQYYIAGIRASGGGNLKGFWCDTANNFYFSLSGLTTNESATKQLVNTANTWFHVAGVYNGSTIKLYVNGEEVDSRTASGTTAAITAGFSIGRFGDQAASYMGGKVRNFRIWNVARTQDQIRTDMNVDTPSVTTGLQGNWILNNAYTDSSGNGYTLTASGSPTFSTTYPDALDLTENGTYLKKHKITIDNTKVSGSADLTDVPIVLTESNFLADAFSNSLNGGADIRFSTDIDGKVRLAHEIVTWNTGTSVAEVHVKVNTLSYNADTDIYVHYNNSSAVALNENEAFGKHQVYVSGYKLKSHLQAGSVDSTLNNNDGTNTNITFGTTYGKLGEGSLYNGSSSKIAITNNATLRPTTAFWVSAWIKTSSSSNQVIFESYQQNGAPAGWLMYLNAGKLGFFTGKNSGLTQGVDYQLVADADTLNDGNWHYVVGYWSGTQLRIFLDGAEAATAVSWTTAPVYHANNAIRYGVNEYVTGTSTNDWFDGSIDEVSVYVGTLNTDYITTLYNNQNSPATFAIPQSLSNGNFFMFL